MGVYCFLCKYCGGKVSIINFLFNEDVDCPDCERPMLRDFKEENVGVNRSNIRAVKEK